MKPKKLLLHILGKQQHGQWTLLCLDFDLAVQSDCLQDAEVRLKDAIKGYLRDALTGEDEAYAQQLLTRRAPLRYWAMYYFFDLVSSCRKGRNGHISRHESIPLVPA